MRRENLHSLHDLLKKEWAERKGGNDVLDIERTKALAAYRFGFDPKKTGEYLVELKKLGMISIDEQEGTVKVVEQ
ncbi:MAG: hypothetical protein HY296_07645 [Thaumarchaeota archaeon]|nr:hypothetical protein [Nitrososphaerota archaeon]